MTSGWVDLATVVGSIAAVAAVVLWFIRPPRRVAQICRVTCDVRSNFKLLQSTAPTRTDFELRIRGKSVVDNPSLATVRIENTGTLPVAPDDIYDSVKLTVHSGVILNAVVTDRSEPAPDLEVSNFNEHQIELTKGLLNPGDWVDVQVIVSDLQRDSLAITPSGRIKGGTVESRGSQEPEVSNRMLGTWLILGLQFAASAAYVVIYAVLYRSAQRLSASPAADLLAQVILLLYVSTLISLLLLSASGAYSYWLIRDQRPKTGRPRKRT